MNVAFVAFGSSFRGIIADEESSSNCAVLEAPAYKILHEKFNAKFFICGPVQLKTREIINNPEWVTKYPYLKDVTICSPETEPKNVDLIWVQAGSDNLRLTGKYGDLNLPCAAFVYRLLKKYPKAKVVYYQGDFAAPFWYTGECYDGLYKKLFDINSLWRYRNCHILAAGSGSEALYREYLDLYSFDEVVKIDFLAPDTHFLIDLTKSDYKISEQLNSIAFAGKQRIIGSREVSIQTYLNHIKQEFILAGKWKPDTVKDFEIRNPRFKYIGKLKEYKDVLDLYNTSGSTIYFSSKEYHRANTVTSRMYDAISSKSLPFINAADYPTFAKVFGDFPELKVGVETIDERFLEFKDPNKRNRVIKGLYHAYHQKHETVNTKFIYYIHNILTEQVQEREFKSNFEQLVRDNFKRLRRNRPKTDAELNERVEKFFRYKEQSFDNLLSTHVVGNKTQFGLFETYRNREAWSDVPPEKINQIKEFLTT